MNWQKKLPGVGGLAVVVGIALVLLNSRGLAAPVKALDYAGWLMAGFGTLAVLIGLSPPQLFSIFMIPELRRKIFITLGFLVVYRIGYYVPLPMIDQDMMAEKMGGMSGGTVGRLLGFVSMFSGGNLSNACVFAMGIMPYISASIIMQLLSSGVLPSLEKLRKEGQSGQKKINEYTRYLTVPICIVQSVMLYQWLTRPEPNGMGLLIRDYADSAFLSFFFGATAVLTMTCGSLFLMWLGEQIDEYGIGNGISLIIMAGIIARIPDAIGVLAVRPEHRENQGLDLHTRQRDRGREFREDRRPRPALRRRRRRRDRDYQSPATHPDAKCQARPRPARVRRDAELPADEGQRGRRHARHLREHPAHPAGLPLQHRFTNSPRTRRGPEKLGAVPAGAAAGFTTSCTSC